MAIERRGRPKEEEPVERPRQYTAVHYNIGADTTSHWYYDLDKSPNPLWVEQFYPAYFKDNDDEVEPKKGKKKKIKKISLTKQTFLNPANGKQVGYARARALGLLPKK